MLLQNCLSFLEYVFRKISYKSNDELEPYCNCNLCYTCKTISYFTGQHLKKTVTYSKNV